jgi:hypothetical protein
LEWHFLAPLVCPATAHFISSLSAAVIWFSAWTRITQATLHVENNNETFVNVINKQVQDADLNADNVFFFVRWHDVPLGCGAD